MLLYFSDLHYEVDREVIIQMLKTQKYRDEASPIYDMVLVIKLTFYERLSIIGIKDIQVREDFFTALTGICKVVDTKQASKNFLSSKLSLDTIIDKITGNNFNYKHNKKRRKHIQLKLVLLSNLRILSQVCMVMGSIKNW